MAEYQFRIPSDWKLDPYHANSVHIVGLDGIPWPCRISVSRPANDSASESDKPRILTVNRNQDESGRLYLLYDFEQLGEHLICTGTLMPNNDDPYDLLLELARGTLNRMRNQTSIWEEGGLVIEDSTRQKVHDATSHLGNALFCVGQAEADQFAMKTLETTIEAVYELANTFSKQISKFRRERAELPQFWIANQVGNADQFKPSVDLSFAQLATAKLPPDANDESCSATQSQLESINKKVIVGPLLDASIGGFSESMLQLDDFLARKDRLLSDAQQTLRSLPKNTAMLRVASGLNGTGHRNLSYPQQLQATVDLLQLVEDSDVDVPTMVSFDFPWAERLAGAVGGTHPLQIADSLIRQGVELSFLGLEINLDLWPNGSTVRDPLQWIDLVDIWAQLGLPMVLCLRAPCGGTAETKGAETRNQTCSNLSDQQRIDFLKTALPMMVARPSVHGLIFQQWQDSDDPRYPNSGIVKADGSPKEIFAVLEAVSQASGL